MKGVTTLELPLEMAAFRLDTAKEASAAFLDIYAKEV